MKSDDAMRDFVDGAEPYRPPPGAKPNGKARPGPAVAPPFYSEVELAGLHLAAPP